MKLAQYRASIQELEVNTWTPVDRTCQLEVEAHRNGLFIAANIKGVYRTLHPSYAESDSMDPGDVPSPVKGKALIPVWVRKP